MRVVWDLPVRLFHWSLVLAIVYAWYAVEILEDLEQHFLAGYCILTLILFRLVWGFVGSFYARFNSFLYSLTEICSYLKTLRGRSGKRYVGHNPIGGLSVVAMLGFILLQTATGLFSTDDYYSGPLNALVAESTAATITELHHLNFDIVTGLIALHLLAIVFYRFYKKENLIGAMLTGKKAVQECADTAPGNSKLLLAALVFCTCAAGVYLLANASFESEQAAAEYNFY
jgi:cytochrome b